MSVCERLREEFADAVALRSARHLAQAIELSVPLNDVEHSAPLWGVATVDRDAAGIYQPAETLGSSPEKHWILPVGRISPDLDSWEELVDLVAINPTVPDRWWCRRRSWPLLGIDHHERTIFMGEPLLLVSTPVAWLQRGGNACVVIDWSFQPQATFAGATEIVCDTPALARQLHRRIDECNKPFRIRTRPAPSGGTR